VLLKRNSKGDKFDSKFYTTIYTVTNRERALITVEDEQENRLARNVTAVKRVNQVPVEEQRETVEVTRK